MLLHLQAGILGKEVGSAIAPPYLLCRSGLFWQRYFFCFLQRMSEAMDSDADAELIKVEVEERPTNDLEITIPVTTDDTPA